MVDHKPPKSVGDEREILQLALQFQRDSIIRCCDGVSPADATWSPVPSGTDLLWLVRHAAFAEAVWVLDRFVGAEDVLAHDSVLVAEPSGAGDLADALDLFRATSSRVDEVVRSASLDALTRRTEDDPQVSLRWILVHLVEELARHAGHADILRELIDGETGR